VALPTARASHQRFDHTVVSMERDVSVIIPHVPVRPNSLAKAIKSAVTQTVKPRDIIVATDLDREGAGPTRNRALAKATTTWCAFLDDDDLWLPKHLEVLLDDAEQSKADVVYSGCTVIGQQGQVVPRREEWGRFGLPFNEERLRQKSYLPVTSLVRTELAQRAWFEAPEGSLYDDWGFYLRMLDLGAVFHHVPEITWIWSHNGKNTSGQPDRW
jgi:glycosyltransferase involved in cell wall biosynthesis